MEQLSQKTGQDFWKDKKMAAVIHSGYPQDIQRKASFAICENFAEEMGMEWLSGIGFGGSPIIDGKPLEEVGRFTKWMRKALEEMAASLEKGEQVSEEAEKYAQKHFPSIPLWILKIMLNLKVRMDARKNGVKFDQQPYLKNDKEEV
jgi:hypothetical protein